MRGTAKVTQVGGKIQEVMLQWYGHCTRRDEEWIGSKMMELQVEGVRGGASVVWTLYEER